MGDLITPYVKPPYIPEQGVLGHYIDKRIIYTVRNFRTILPTTSSFGRPVFLFFGRGPSLFTGWNLPLVGAGRFWAINSLLTHPQTHWHAWCSWSRTTPTRYAADYPILISMVHATTKSTTVSFKCLELRRGFNDWYYAWAKFLLLCPRHWVRCCFFASCKFWHCWNIDLHCTRLWVPLDSFSLCV